MPTAPNGTSYGDRSSFLIAMYEQLLGDINRHIIVIWQMVGVLAAAILGLVFAEKQGIPTAYAAILVWIVISWVLEHIYDSNYWYNRNLVMITNIERIFLPSSDLEYVHPYFSAHRKAGSFLEHLNIMRRYALIVAGLALAYFLAEDVLPSWEWGGNPDIKRWLAVAVFGSLIARNSYLVRKYDTKYADYLAISPGIAINQEINFRGTHGKVDG